MSRLFWIINNSVWIKNVSTNVWYLMCKISTDRIIWTKYLSSSSSYCVERVKTELFPRMEVDRELAKIHNCWSHKLCKFKNIGIYVYSMNLFIVHCRTMQWVSKKGHIQNNKNHKLPEEKLLTNQGYK